MIHAYVYKPSDYYRDFVRSPETSRFETQSRRFSLALLALSILCWLPTTALTFNHKRLFSGTSHLRSFGASMLSVNCFSLERHERSPGVSHPWVPCVARCASLQLFISQIAIPASTVSQNHGVSEQGLSKLLVVHCR